MFLGVAVHFQLFFFFPATDEMFQITVFLLFSKELKLHLSFDIQQYIIEH